jgi:hypothetical protein
MLRSDEGFDIRGSFINAPDKEKVPEPARRKTRGDVD